MNNKSVDKVNMSLDDIIKLNRNQSRQNKFTANRNLNVNNKQNGNRNNFQRNNNRNQYRRQQPQQHIQVNNKPYGMLNRSKTIQKRNPNVRVLQAQQNNQQQQRQMARINGNQASRIPRNPNNRRRRIAVSQRPQFNRLGAGGLASSSRIKFQNGHNNAAKNKNNGNINNQRNRGQKFLSQQSQYNTKNQGAVQQRRRQQLRQPRAANNVKTKIAMQSARKNVMKAKRLLVNKISKKGPIQQIMTQRYAKSMGLVQNAGAKISNKIRRINSNAIRPVMRRPLQKSSKMLTVNINNKLNKINRVKQQQRQKLQKTSQMAKQVFKNSNLNRNKQQQQGRQSNAGRKVFF